MRIITSGSAYLDIDAYAGCVAYAELLQLQGVQALAVSTAPLNESISTTIRSWPAPLQTSYAPSAEDTFTIVDLSNLEYFDEIVDIGKVDEVIDHHVGFEQYWHDKLGDNAKIEFIGAACTLVYEQWVAAGLVEKMTVLSARLLVCGILDNTLNFGAKITSPRDVEAYKTLLRQADLPDSWTGRYFKECQAAILTDIPTAIKNDTKVWSAKTFDRPVSVGQMTVWNSKHVLSEHQSEIQEALKSVQPDWFMNLISVEEGKSYFITDNKAVQAWLSPLLGIQFDGPVAVADRLWLRKEIIKQDAAA